MTGSRRVRAHAPNVRERPPRKRRPGGLARGDRPDRRTCRSPSLSDEKVSYCHATADVTNPYTLLTTAVASIIQQGHHLHLGPVFPDGGGPRRRGDIIPPFDYFGGSFPGLNLPRRTWTCSSPAARSTSRRHRRRPPPRPRPRPIDHNDHDGTDDNDHGTDDDDHGTDDNHDGTDDNDNGTDVTDDRDDGAGVDHHDARSRRERPDDDRGSRRNDCPGVDDEHRGHDRQRDAADDRSGLAVAPRTNVATRRRGTAPAASGRRDPGADTGHPRTLQPRAARRGPGSPHSASCADRQQREWCRPRRRQRRLDRVHRRGAGRLAAQALWASVSVVQTRRSAPRRARPPLPTLPPTPPPQKLPPPPPTAGGRGRTTGIRVRSVTYLPVGAGGYHWKVGDAGRPSCS